MFGWTNSLKTWDQKQKEIPRVQPSRVNNNNHNKWPYHDHCKKGGTKKGWSQWRGEWNGSSGYECLCVCLLLADGLVGRPKIMHTLWPKGEWVDPSSPLPPIIALCLLVALIHRHTPSLFSGSIGWCSMSCCCCLLFCLFLLWCLFVDCAKVRGQAGHRSRERYLVSGLFIS